MTTFQSDLEKSRAESLLLSTEKQTVFIDFLLRYSALNDMNLAYLIGTTVEKLQDVHKQRDCLDAFEAKKLIECFCLWCGS